MAKGKITAEKKASAPSFQPRLDLLKKVIKDTDTLASVEAIFRQNQGDWGKIQTQLEETVKDIALRKKIALQYELAAVTDDNEPVLNLLEQEGSDLREITLTYDRVTFAKKLNVKLLPPDTVGATATQRKASYARLLENKLFNRETSATLQRMATKNQLPIEEKEVNEGIIRFFENQPDFNIRTTSVYKAFEHPDAFRNVLPGHVGSVMEKAKELQRIQALSLVTDAIPVMMKNRLNAAYLIAGMPKSVFVRRYKTQLGEQTAREIYSNAANLDIRNEYALETIRETVSGTGVKMIDEALRSNQVDMLAWFENKVKVNWEKLFGSATKCECGHCNSVYSPAAYFVELLQYLRNNNLGDDKIKKFPEGYTNTPLEVLFNRRPDLGDLELTHENTNTLIPYIDLANEVMESYVVHKSIVAQNITDEESDELIAQPQHINEVAYKTLSKAVFPFTLPYHQPLDAIRVFLDHMKTSRCELIDTFGGTTDFRDINEFLNKTILKRSSGGKQKYVLLDRETIKKNLEHILYEFNVVARNRALAAERLGLSEQEYIILTKHSFLRSEFYEYTIRLKSSDSLPINPVRWLDYHEIIGCKDTQEYYGFKAGNAGKNEMLSTDETKESGLTFVKEQFLKRTGMDYEDLIELLKTQYVNPNFSVYTPEQESNDLIILTAVKNKDLSVFGDLYENFTEPLIRPFALLQSSGKIHYIKEGHIANVDLNCMCVDLKGEPYKPPLNCFIRKQGETGRNITQVGRIINNEIQDIHGTKATFSGVDNPCNLDSFRLKHLDGSGLTITEYDRIHRFIRLWRKLGWTIDEVDKAIASLSPGNREITPELLEQLAALKKLKEKTGIPILNLLPLWDKISTRGEKSLYQKLFLKHQQPAIYKVFEPDSNGEYLKNAGEIASHIPALMSTLKTKTLDIEAILRNRKINADPKKDDLTVETVSTIYRDSLFAKILSVKVDDLLMVEALFGSPYENPENTLKFFEQWDRLQGVGFKLSDLHYLLGCENPKHAIYPSKAKLIRLAKTLSDGLLAIEAAHPDVKEDEATIELIRQKAGLIFEQPVVDAIVDLIEGTTVYTTTGDVEFWKGAELIVERKLQYDKIHFDSENGIVKVTGILSPEEKEYFYQALNGTQAQQKEWRNVIDRLSAQPQQFFDDTLYAIFEDSSILLKADINISHDQQIPVAEEEEKPESADFSKANTANEKRFYFLEHFLPYLRNTLQYRFIIDTLSAEIGQKPEIVDVLTSRVYDIPKGEAFKPNQQLLADNDGKWQGFLIPAVDGEYTFVASKDSIDIKINGETTQKRNAYALKSTEVYSFEVAGLTDGTDLGNADLSPLKWKTPTMPSTTIPASVMFAQSDDTFKNAYIQLQKGAILTQVFQLDSRELEYFKDKIKNLSLDNILSLQAYTQLRSSLPKTEINLVGYFRNISLATDQNKRVELLEELTKWDKSSIEALAAAGHFNMTAQADFSRIENLLKMQKALRLASKMGMAVAPLFAWAQPIANFEDHWGNSLSIQQVLSSHYAPEDWKQVVKPLNDRLRTNQRNALIDYLLVQPAVRDASVENADGLFEFFLIDVQMEPCMQTSRIKQAISSVQLFIQRCFLGLETGTGITNLDKDRWEWMQRYRIWEANRKVFLYPENWIEPNLRDEKSPFFKELESELLQKDINKQTVTDALKNYLYKVDEVANMEVVGLHIEGTKKDDKNWNTGSKLHVFSRTRNAPYFFYYRYLALDEMNWYPWEKMQVDIPSYDVEDADGRVNGNGTYLIPVVWNNRLLVFFPQFMKKTKPNPNSQSGNFEDLAGKEMTDSKPIEYWEIKMAWSEYRNGKWTQKQISKDAIYHECYIPKSKGPDSPDGTKPKDDHTDITKIEFPDRIIFQPDTPIEIVRVYLTNLFEKLGPIVDYFDEYISNYKPNLSVNNEIDLLRDSIQTLSNLLNNPKNTQINKHINTKALDETIPGLAAFESYSMNEINTLCSKVRSSLNVLYNATAENILCDISKYDFAAEEVDGNTGRNKLLKIKIFNSKDRISYFEFDGNSLYLPPVFTNDSEENLAGTNFFHYSEKISGSIKPLTLANEFEFTTPPSIINSSIINYSIKFNYPFVRDFLGNIQTKSSKDFFLYADWKLDVHDPFGNHDGSFNELKAPYSLYTWEIFFHSPTMLADYLSKSQQFEEAMKWYHFVFNPYSNSEIKEGDTSWAWQFYPFKQTKGIDFLEGFFNELANNPNTANEKITEWREKPFMPHVIARSRPASYMKWVVMRYIDNLVAWGDYLFRQDTIESINQATQLYVLAGHILGPRPQSIPLPGKIKPATYLSMLEDEKWDAFSNAKTEMELLFPFNAQNVASDDAADSAGAPNIYGSAQTLYFCIPDNPQLLAYWDTVADRLFKIRHCQNIQGVFRSLALFEPPIDPALLVQAAAQGLSLSSVLNDLNAPMPNYRFFYLVNKALELCNELKSLGNSLLSVLEKKDAEQISIMRARHESSLHNLVMEVRKQQLEEANKSLESLQHSRKSPEHRMKYYLQLIGDELEKIPGADAEFSELANAIEKPVSESGLKLSKYEKEDVEEANEAYDWQKASGILEAIASNMFYVPNFSFDMSPFGVGMKIHTGGHYFGLALQGIAKGLQVESSDHSFQSTAAAKKGSFQRALQDRIHQANATGYEIKQIDKQITAQQIRISIAEQEITNQQKQIDNALEVEEFLKSKYTNEELYTWMEGSIKTLYHQAYTLAYDLAKKAEKVYRFERGLTSSNFIQFGYWDSARSGLLAGERLYIGLKQLEAAYQEHKGHDYEITKHISLRQITPIALLALRETGKCEFSLPEVLFDMDFPGHYKRRIRSVSISIPCVAGPYTGINCTARLLENKIRTTAIANSNGYAEKFDDTEDRFMVMNVPIQSIAVSSAQGDSGVFELNFKDERFMPFEGAGVISSWRLELPTEFRQFDYNTISDVIIHMNYTARDGGDALKNQVNTEITNAVNAWLTDLANSKQPLTLMLSMKHHFPVEWEQLKSSGATEVTVQEHHFPFMMRGKSPMIESTDITFHVKRDVAPLEREYPKWSITIHPTGKISLLTEEDRDAPNPIQFKKPSEWADDLYLVIPYRLS